MKHMNALPLKKNKMDDVLSDVNYAVQIKLKGIRAFIYAHEYNVLIMTRGGHDITRMVPHIAKESCKLEKNYVYDCELYYDKVDDAVLAGMVNPNRISPVDTSMVKACVFDIANIDSVLIERYDELVSIMSNKDLEHIQLIPLFIMNKDEKLGFIEKAKNDGLEGVMFKNINCLYVHGKRPANSWYKYKFVNTYDVVITGFLPGKGKYKGLIGSILYGAYINGKFIKDIGSVSGMDDKTRELMSAMPEAFYGKVMEVIAQNVTVNNVLEHPVFVRIRDDKRAEECVLEEG